MFKSTSNQRPQELLALLQQDVAKLDQERDALRGRLGVANYRKAKISTKKSFRHFQLWLRSPVNSFELWPLGLLIVVTCAAGGGTLAAVNSYTERLGTSAASSALVAAATSLALAYCLFVPSTASLKDVVAGAQRQASDIDQQIRAIENALNANRELLNTRITQRDGILASIEYRAAQFLEQDWRSMRGVEWETFLRDVFKMLGYQVWTTKGSGDQGVDLIVASVERRCAIQAKGYAKTVGNGAVQEAVTGRAFHQCNCCAVVTNSTYSQSAYELAKCNDCLLIGEEQIPDLIRGRIAI